MEQALALGFIKLSFVFFYRRIFNARGRTTLFNIVSLLFLVLITIWMVAFFLGILLICPGHLKAYWGPSTERSKYCWDTTYFLLVYSFSDAVTEVMIFLLPIPSVG